MSTELEIQRSALEELERIEQAIADRLQSNPSIYTGPTSGLVDLSFFDGRKRGYKQTLLQQHEVRKFLNRRRDLLTFLTSELSSDSNQPGNTRNRRKDIQKITDPTHDMQQFYRAVADIREHHRKYPDGVPDDLQALYAIGSARHFRTEDPSHSAEPQTSRKDPKSRKSQNDPKRRRLLSAFAGDIRLSALFSGEEQYGKFLDLIVFHERFVNLKAAKRRNIRYREYLDVFDSFSDSSLLSQGMKTEQNGNSEYLSYVTDLGAYLEGFLRRTNPLSNVDASVKSIEAQFEAQWSREGAKGGEKAGEEGEEGEGEEKDGGKEIYCSACRRSFSKKTVFDAHLSGKKHKRNVAQQSNPNLPTNAESVAKIIAFAEYRVRELAQLLDKERNNTKMNVERRAALTQKERESELQSLEEETDWEEMDTGNNENPTSDSEEEEMYNPLKLPMGPDGRPIPYWLWKLHGLGIEYRCEICGNQVYNGRRVFEKHFMEATHIAGLKKLGIEPSVVFRDVTKIEDAVKCE